MIAVSCKYAPVEMLEGFGTEVKRLDPSPASFSCSENCTHPDMCSYAKALIEEIKSEHIQEVVLTDCCDAVRRVYDLIKKDPEIQFAWILPLPHKTGEAEIKLFIEDLKKLCEAYENYSGTRFDYHKAVLSYRRQRDRKPESLDADYIEILGAHGGHQLYQAVQNVFPHMRVVDNTCSSNRYLRNEPESENDFFSWYGEALLNQEMPCMRMWKNGGRHREGRKPEGIVFHTIKFCDYYGFEYMSMRDDDVRMVKIETDTTKQSSGQLKTRLEAFREELGIMPSVKKSGESSMETYYVGGIDSGSASTDAVIMDNHHRIVAECVLSTGAGSKTGAERALEQVLHIAGLEKRDLVRIVTTGYGRDHIGAYNTSITEISCHAKGAHYLNPNVRTVIDIGGQDSKVISLDDKGSVVNFVMNDKCAAGTGRFLEMQARTMQMSMEEMSALGMKWKNDLTISSMCTVFAESEVVSLIAENRDSADIIHGLNKAVAGRTASLVHRMNCRPAYMMTGGVARNEGVVKCLEDVLQEKIEVSAHAQACGAIGACLYALEE